MRGEERKKEREEKGMRGEGRKRDKRREKGMRGEERKRDKRREKEEMKVK